MPRSALPQSYIKSAGTVIEGFESLTGWVQGLTGNGTMTADTINVHSGSAGIRLAVTAAGLNTSMAKAFSSAIQFTSETLFHLWFFVPDYPSYQNIFQIVLHLTSYSTNPAISWANQATAAREMLTGDVVPGWNHLCVRAGDFTLEGTESWSRPMTAMRLRTYAQAGKTGYITFDNFFYAQESMPGLMKMAMFR